MGYFGDVDFSEYYEEVNEAEFRERYLAKYLKTMRARIRKRFPKQEGLCAELNRQAARMCKALHWDEGELDSSNVLTPFEEAMATDGDIDGAVDAAIRDVQAFKLG